MVVILFGVNGIEMSMTDVIEMRLVVFFLAEFIAMILDFNDDFVVGFCFVA